MNDTPTARSGPIGVTLTEKNARLFASFAPGTTPLTSTSPRIVRLPAGTLFQFSVRIVDAPDASGLAVCSSRNVVPSENRTRKVPEPPGPVLFTVTRTTTFEPATGVAGGKGAGGGQGSGR